MSARFAGSRSLDERRRRRIAGEWDRSAVSAGSGPSSSGETTIPSPQERARKKTGRKPSRRLPLRRIVSPRFWKHSLVAFCLAVVGFGIVAAGWYAEPLGKAYGPAVQELVEIPDGRLVRGYGGLLLFLAAQFALLIWWVRSRSHTDFSGRYRIWSWAAVVGFVFSASVSLGLHHVWSRTLGFLLSIDFSRAETLCWLAPAVGCGSVLWRDLRADMQDCRTSTLFLRLALLGWSVAVLQLLGVGAAWTGRWAPLFISAAALFGHYCLLISLLFHARFVIFVSAEPPALRTPWWRRTLRRGGVLLKSVVVASCRGVLRRKRPVAATVEEAKGEETNSDGPVPAEPRPSISPAGSSRKKSVSAGHTTDETAAGSLPSRTDPADTTEEPDEFDESAETGWPDRTEIETGEEKQRGTPQPERLQHRHDTAHPVPQPKKLSKRERRRRRKQRVARHQ